jgi:hypothetical protein
MENFLELENQTQRYSISNDDLTDKLLAYALLCQDEEDVYKYMEDNGLGMKNPKLWYQKFELAKDKREF